MKNLKSIKTGIILLAALVLTITSCQKLKVEDQGNEDKLSEASLDEATVLETTDMVYDEVNDFLSSMGNDKSALRIPCNATVDSSEVMDEYVTYFITYDGLNCRETVYREGQVRIKKHIGTHWWMEGSAVETTIIDLQLTKVSTNRTVTINGEEIFTNVSGGIILLLGATIDRLEHKVEGNFEINFPNSTSKSWNIARQKVFTGTPEALLCAFDGFGSTEDYDNLVLWGTNRMDESFYTQITESNVVKQECNWDAISGVRIYNLPAEDKTVTLTFGYNDNDELIEEDECPTKFKAEWIHGNDFGTFYLPL